MTKRTPNAPNQEKKTPAGKQLMTHSNTKHDLSRWASMFVSTAQLKRKTFDIN
jgi:hypothetical protein